jgi:dipeptidyl aminopeptidase/acylaminoacyl peptidase
MVDKWNTPMLVIHGGKDFRVPETEGMQAFQVLQIKGIPSKFLYFPDEGHWITKPQNGILWYREYFNWLGTYLK